MVKQFYDLSTLKKRLEKEESIAVDYLATDNNWHLARFIVQSRAEDGTARQVLLVIRVISEEKRREKYREMFLEDLIEKEELRPTVPMRQNQSSFPECPMTSGLL